MDHIQQALKPFDKYDRLNVLPPKVFLEGFMRICDFARLKKIKLNAQFLSDERRAYFALKNGDYQ